MLASLLLTRLNASLLTCGKVSRMVLLLIRIVVNSLGAGVFVVRSVHVRSVACLRCSCTSSCDGVSLLCICRAC